MNGGVRVYETRVTHVRRTPWKRSFTHRSWMWVVDVDAVGESRGVARLLTFFTGAVVAADHLDGAPGSLRASLCRFVRREGLAVEDGRVLLAAQPRVLGFCFNPISVWWCLDGDDAVVLTVVEVHNTYGDRHAYVVRPGPGGRARVDKAMYVSPFHGVDGFYDVLAPRPTDHLDLTVTLRTAAGERFSASLTGRAVPSAPWWAAFATWRDALRIRGHGIQLWARRLPVQPRPPHRQEALK